MSPESEIDALVADFYAAFDNRSSRVPTVEALLALLGDEATITRVGADGIDCWDPLAFAAPRIAMLTDGTLTEFHEWETASRTEVWRDIASRWSTYDKEGTLDGADYRGGGRKFIQFHRRDGGWLINSVLWQDR